MCKRKKVRGGQGRCERRSEAIVKIQKKMGGGGGGDQGGCERRSEAFVKIQKKNIFFFIFIFILFFFGGGGGGGGRVGGGGRGVRVDVNGEVKLL